VDEILLSGLTPSAILGQRPKQTNWALDRAFLPVVDVLVEQAM